MTSLLWLITWFSVAVLVFAESEIRFLMSITDSRGYDKYKAPATDKVVHVGIHINSILNVDEVKQELELDLYLRTSWFDHRLRYDPAEFKSPLTLKDGWSRIWAPEVYFENSRQMAVVSAPVSHRLLNVYHTGRVWSVIRYKPSVGCAMDFSRFPFDVQQCRIKIQLFGDTSGEIRLGWMNGTEALTMSPSVTDSITQFMLTDSETGDCQDDDDGGLNSCLYIKLELHRSSSYVVRHYHLPMILLLVVNYFSFLLGRNIPLIRFGYLLIILLLMSLTSLTCSLTMNIPKVSYFTYYDIWLMTSYGLYFLSVLHFAVVMMIKNRTVTSSRTSYSCTSSSPQKSLLEQEGDEGDESDVETRLKFSPALKSNARIARYLDLVAIILYPLLVLAFFTLYCFYAFWAQD